ncbi:hypothetical protein NT6N_20580 [Oceaniferula spumae]|uniref:Ice-binding protein C-terminal domain-containing protein n=1 Tax=Oceaniferula spumae TaxID=2979115 RepID=A0AAT9FM39_9BACT
MSGASAGNALEIVYNASSGITGVSAIDNGNGTVTITAIPEPSSTALLGLGVLAFFLRRGR